MSGRSLDYAYLKIDDIIENLQYRSNLTQLHKTFIRHLTKVSKALYDLEWMLSGDTSEGSEIDAIRKVVTVNEELESVVKDAKKAKKDLEEVLTRSSHEPPLRRVAYTVQQINAMKWMEK